MKNVGNSSRGRSQGVMIIFRAPYRAHCAVIFATAQLSCLQVVSFQCYSFRNVLLVVCGCCKLCGMLVIITALLATTTLTDDVVALGCWAGQWEIDTETCFRTAKSLSRLMKILCWRGQL